MKRFILRVALACIVGVLFGGGFARAAATANVDEVTSEINGCVKDADADCAVKAMAKWAVYSNSGQAKLQFENTRNSLNFLLSSGKPNFINLVQQDKYGEDIVLKTYYVSMPILYGSPASEFLFIRYTFMRTSGGWKLTNVVFKQSGIYPPNF
ncbi:hypothetical protein AB4037_25155 [Labrys sp. KB_33_2]|uniref:hypothetical protein n=1 Tax=Labrys sp. KB_33_2 TaxID=3237479 RepID=UPI003F8DBE50